MRTLMMFASVLIVCVGTFCLANSSAPFLSVAFVVGLAVLFLGVAELVVNRVTVMNSYGSVSEVNVEGFTSVILGIVFLAGQVTEDVAITALFALWVTIIGLKTVSASDFFHLRGNSSIDNMTKVIGAFTTLFGVYMFFNNRIFHLKVLVLIGAALLLIGMNRFRIAMAIEYQKPQILTGTREKLEEARREEKEAMQRAKDAIRETKEIQRRIDKLSKEYAREEQMRSNSEERRRAKSS